MITIEFWLKCEEKFVDTTGEFEECRAAGWLLEDDENWPKSKENWEFNPKSRVCRKKWVICKTLIRVVPSQA